MCRCVLVCVCVCVCMCEHFSFFLHAHRANHIHREVDTRGEEGERERGRVEGGEREGVKEGVSGRGNSTPQDKTMSNHYRILMSWERDYPLGLRATRAPVLYALDNIPEKVKAVKGQFLLPTVLAKRRKKLLFWCKVYICIVYGVQEVIFTKYMYIHQGEYFRIFSNFF